MDDLVGAREVAELLGVTRQRVQQLTKDETFPVPVARIGLGNVWRLADIQAWIRNYRRPANGL